MDADRRQALVGQGKALKQQLSDMEVRLQEVENQLQVQVVKLNNFVLRDDQQAPGCNRRRTSCRQEASFLLPTPPL